MEKNKTTCQGKNASSVCASDTERTERKLHFLWDECQPEEMDTGHVWTKTAGKIREYEAQAAVRRTRLRRRWVVRVLCGAAALWALWWGADAFLRWRQEASSFLSEPLGSGDAVCLDKDDAVRLVLLPDSTRMWVNEGSRVVYPRVFAQERREIFVEGEVYLEVTRDEARPFVVRTDDFTVDAWKSPGTASERRSRWMHRLTCGGHTRCGCWKASPCARCCMTWASFMAWR